MIIVAIYNIWPLFCFGNPIQKSNLKSEETLGIIVIRIYIWTVKSPGMAITKAQNPKHEFSLFGFHIEKQTFRVLNDPNERFQTPFLD